MRRAIDDDLDFEPVSKRKTRGREAAPTAPRVANLLPALHAVHDAIRPLLTTPMQLVHMKRERRPPPELAFKQIRKLLDTTTSALESLELSPGSIESIRYALVASIDEVMQSESGAIKEFWRAHLLQLELFGETRAGEGFFERLERLKDGGALLEMHVYYVVLLLGFHGIYGQHGELERENLIESVRGVLVTQGLLTKKPVLAPHGARPREPGVDRTRNRLLQWLAAAAATLSVVWYFGLLFTVDAQATNLSSQIRSQTENLDPDLTAAVP